MMDNQETISLCFLFFSSALIVSSFSLFVFSGTFIKSNIAPISSFVFVEEGIADIIRVSEHIVEVKELKFFSFFPLNRIDFNQTAFSHKIPYPTDYIVVGVDGKPVYPSPGDNCEINYYTSFQLFHLNDVAYSSYSSFIVGSTDYCLDRYRQHHGRKSFSKVFKNAICITNIFPDCYGDFIFGSLVRLTVVPRYLFGMCHTLETTNLHRGYLPEMMKILGIDSYKFTFVGETELVFCENLYTVLPNYIQNEFGHTPFLLHSVHGPFENEFARRIRSFFGAEKIEPYEYTIYNRPAGHKRSFVNFVELHEALRREFPHLNVTRFEGNFPTIESNVERYSRIKWYFSFCGSNFMNCYFMAEGTAATMVMCGNYDVPAVQVCLSRSIHLVSFMCRCEHYGSPISVDATRALQYVRISLQKLGAI